MQSIQKIVYFAVLSRHNRNGGEMSDPTSVPVQCQEAREAFVIGRSHTLFFWAQRHVKSCSSCRDWNEERRASLGSQGPTNT